MITATLIFLLCAASVRAVPVAGTLGVAVSVTANTATTIAYGAASLDITASANTDVTLAAYAAATTSVPVGYSTLSFGSEVGFTLTVTGGASITSARLTTPPLEAAAAATITGSVQAACLRFDTAANAYTSVAIDSYNVATKAVTVDLPVAGTYVFASVQANVPLPTLYAEARATSTSNSSFRYPGGLDLRVATSTSNELTVTFEASSNHASPSGQTALGAFMAFSLDHEEAVDATITYTYNATAAAAAALDEATLHFRYWSTASSSWELPASSASVDTSAKVITQATTHFSQWGLFGDSSSSSPSSDSSASDSGGTSGGSTTTTGSLGVAVSVAAGVETTINVAGGATLVVTAESDAEVTLAAFASTTTAMPSGYSALQLGAQVGFTVSVSGVTRLAKAELTTPPLTAAVAAVLTGSVKAGCLRFDADARAYTGVAVKSYNVVTRAITVDLPQLGTYVFASVQANVPLPTLYAEARATSNTEARTFGYKGGLTLRVKTASSNELTTNFSTTSTHSKPSGKAALSAYLDFSLKKEEAVEATISYTYSSSAVVSANLEETSMHFRYWSSASASWELPEASASVDVQARVITQATTHFSQWGVFGDEMAGGSDNDDVDSSAAVSVACSTAVYFVVAAALVAAHQHAS